MTNSSAVITFHPKGGTTALHSFVFEVGNKFCVVSVSGLLCAILGSVELIHADVQPSADSCGIKSPKMYSQ